MIQFYFHSAVRALQKNKSNVFINLIGLSISIACCIVLGIWVSQEYGYNKFIDEENNCHKLYTTLHVNGVYQTHPTSSIPIIKKIEQESVGVKALAYMLAWEEESTIVVNGIQTKPRGRLVSSNFFNVVNRNFLIGDSSTALNSPLSIVISETMAIRHFGPNWEDNIFERTIVLNGWKEVDVKGVFEDFPDNSTLIFDYCLPLGSLSNEHPGNFNYEVFVNLDSNVNFDVLSESISKISQEIVGVNSLLLPFKDTYLLSNFENGSIAGGRIEYLRLFVIVTLFIFLMACINFMNLYSTGAYKRVKEIAMKRIVGGDVSSIRIQVYLETFIIAALSTICAVSITYLSLNYINSLLNYGLVVPFGFRDSLIILGGIVLAVTLIAGTYPALLLSSINSKDIHGIKNKFNIKGLILRKGLFVFQFFIAVVLILFTAGVQNQLKYIAQVDLKFDKANVIYKSISPKELNKIGVVSDRIIRSGSFLSLTSTSFNFQDPIPFTSDLHWPGKSPDDPSLFGIVTVGDDFLRTFKIELLEGRDFRKINEVENPILVNKSALNIMESTSDVLGKMYSLWGLSGEIIGVVDDFHFTSLHNKIEPLIISYQPDQSAFLFGRMKDEDHTEGIAVLREINREYAPNSFFEFFELEESINIQYDSERKISTLSQFFGLISILIACLGLFGVSKFVIERRLRELSIRKVLGASLNNLLFLVAREFLVLITVSLVIAFPMGLYLISQWMNRFYFKTSISSLYYLIPISLLVFSICVSLLLNVYRVRNVDPATNLVC